MNRFNCLHGRPGLLVSVRSADEARIALDGGADVIDVKEPSRGSLGSADAAVVAAVVRAIDGRAPISVAAGELLVDSTCCAKVAGITFAKVGLASCDSHADWPVRWRAAISQWPTSVQPVAVVYADWQCAGAPPPHVVLAEAVSIGCPALLVDTWDKSAGSLFDLWLPEEVASFCRRVSETGMAVVLAGSLDGDRLATAASCDADLIAVRGAVCDGGRTSSISAARVRAVRAGVNLLSPSGMAESRRQLVS